MKIVVSIVLTILSSLYFICHPAVESIMNGTARKVARDPKYLDSYDYSSDVASLYYWKLGIMVVMLVTCIWIIREMLAIMRSGRKAINWLGAPAIAAINIYLVLVIVALVVMSRLSPFGMLG